MSSIHGGNVYETARQLGCAPEDIVDYSASINPLGPPPGLSDELFRHFNRLQHYPDIANHSFLKALARFHHLSVEHIVVGNGSTELIYWLPRLLGIRSTLVVLPTFSEYQKAFEIQGTGLHKLFTTVEAHFQPSAEQLDAVCDAAHPEAVLLTHPGSPAGTGLPRGIRSWLLDRGRREGLFCIVDEVFVDFCEEESLKDLLIEFPKLVLIRSMTKFYGVPGLRLGYLLTSEELARRINGSLPPWSVNTFAQIAGPYCLNQTQYRRATLDLIGRERTRMMKRLNGLKGCFVLPSRANYLLVKLDKDLPPASSLQRDLLLSHRILIRDCSTFEGLDAHYARFAVRLPEENDRLLDAFEVWVGAQTDR